ncbi:hypothetical protein OL233_07845 [Vagococcus sp. PNs007]|uniref:Uncharacterized protein n=1 Tax=Vagococcus proximus TaxID=2991417 RepID=A0ABT5X2I3_9ENTE|nr:hypothetical protein [Vagococcus proximus]MDF0480204.1 hypothetical protein [Vagococcus proximus]
MTEIRRIRFNGGESKVGSQDVTLMTNEELSNFIDPHMTTYFTKQVERELTERSLAGDREAFTLLKGKWQRQVPGKIKTDGQFTYTPTLQLADYLTGWTIPERLLARQVELELKKRIFESDDQAYDIYKWYVNEIKPSRQ